MLNDQQRRILLQRARAAVSHALQETRATLPEPCDESLIARCGAFVSLHIGAELRGCIGMIDPERPLIETVTACAISAATADPRFSPVTMDELHSIRFEISVLSRPRAILGAHELEIGLHGVIVTEGSRKALLLPQVAAQEGWDAAELLTAACRKAGMPPTAWRGSTVRLEAFTAEVFGEDP